MSELRLKNIKRRIEKYCSRGQDDKDFFSFDWISEYSTERKLKLKTGKEANFIVRTINWKTFGSLVSRA